MSEKENKHAVAFAGGFSPLSNLHPHPIEIDDKQYQSSEHYFQCQKCLSSGNMEAAGAVMLAAHPEDAMAAGNVVNKRMDTEPRQKTSGNSY